MSNYSVKITKCGKCQFSYDHLPAKLSGCEEVGTRRDLGRGWDPSFAWPGPDSGEGQDPAGVRPSPQKGRGARSRVGRGSQPAVDTRMTDKQTNRQADRQTTQRERER